MYRKYWLLIQETDEHGHHAAYLRSVTGTINLVSLFKNFPKGTTANLYPTKKAAAHTAQCLNDGWHLSGCYIWDFMEDGTTPAPF